MLNDLKTYVKGNISVGIGYIIVPPDVDRQKYIDTCYAKETVSMYLDFGGFSVNNVRISVDALNLRTLEVVLFSAFTLRKSSLSFCQ